MTAGPKFICPRCGVALEQIRTAKGIFWGCQQCGGRAISVELLRRIFTSESINPLWLHAISGSGHSGHDCPVCRKPMLEVKLTDAADVEVDVCRLCHFVWFDAGETEGLVPQPPPKPAPSLPQKAREAMALSEIDRLAREARRKNASDYSPVWSSIFSLINLL